MARITIDDCMKVIPNRFDLTLAAAYRARQIDAGAQALVEINRDKPTVIALREMAAGKYDAEILLKDRTDAKVLPRPNTLFAEPLVPSSNSLEETPRAADAA